MRLSKVLGFSRARTRNRIFTLGIIITGMLSIAFAVVTFYGQEAGNFVISVDEQASDRGIMLSTNRDFTIPTPRLMSEPLDEARDITYGYLKINEVQATDGNYVDPDFDYVAYTFYLMNSGSESIDVNYFIQITSIYKNLDAGIRVLVIEDDVQTMYQKPDPLVDQFGNPVYYPPTMPESTNFLSSTIVMRELISNFRPGQVKSFSVLVWLEGYDPDTTDEILGGMIRMTMTFSIPDVQGS